MVSDPKVGVIHGGVGSHNVVVRKKAWNRFEHTPAAVRCWPIWQERKAYVPHLALGGH